MARLLKELLRKGVGVDYIAQILAAFQTARQGTGDDADADSLRPTTARALSASSVVHRPSSALVEPLSERGLELF